MEKSKIILDTEWYMRCHKCLRQIAGWNPKIVVGQGDTLEIYHPHCYQILHPEEKE